MNRTERRRRIRPLVNTALVAVVGLLVACEIGIPAVQAAVSGASGVFTVALMASVWWASDERDRQQLANLGALVFLGTLAAHGAFKLAVAFGYQGQPELGALMLLSMLVVMLGDTALGVRERHLDRVHARQDTGRPA